MFIERRRTTRSRASNREGKIVRVPRNKRGIIHILSTREATSWIKSRKKRGEIRERINISRSTGLGRHKERK